MEPDNGLDNRSKILRVFDDDASFAALCGVEFVEYYYFINNICKKVNFIDVIKVKICFL